MVAWQWSLFPQGNDEDTAFPRAHRLVSEFRGGGRALCLWLRLVEINQCNVGNTLFYLIQIKSTGAIHVCVLSKEPFLGYLKAFCLLGALCSAAPEFCSFTAASGADRCQRELRVPQVIFTWCLTLSFTGDRVTWAALVPKAAPLHSLFPSGNPTGSCHPNFLAWCTPSTELAAVPSFIPVNASRKYGLCTAQGLCCCCTSPGRALEGSSSGLANTAELWKDPDSWNPAVISAVEWQLRGPLCFSSNS